MPSACPPEGPEESSITPHEAFRAVEFVAVYRQECASEDARSSSNVQLRSTEILVSFPQQPAPQVNVKMLPTSVSEIRMAPAPSLATPSPV
jgi:hypothetical protein